MSHVKDIPGRPTVVLVHGAFADSSSWNGVIERLQAKGVQVTAPSPANSLRGLTSDSAYRLPGKEQIVRRPRVSGPEYLLPMAGEEGFEPSIS